MARVWGMMLRRKILRMKLVRRRILRMKVMRGGY